MRRQNEKAIWNPGEFMATESTDRKQFDEFYRTHERNVRSTLYSMVDSASVDDLVQETFLRAWKGLSKFESKSSIRTWVYRIAVNVAIDHRRKKALYPVASLSDDEKVLTPSQLSPDNSISPLDREQNSRWIQQGLGELEEIHRAVLVLHYFEGLELSEIARILEIPLGTVKSRLHTAREKLKSYLKGKGVGYEP